jgi:soluble lytic murein transglycosylase
MVLKRMRIMTGIFRRGGIWLLAVLIFVALGSATIHADIYMYRDANGVMHFTNVPVSADYRLFVSNTKPRFKKSRNNKQFDRIIQDASQRYSVDFSLIKAIIRAESCFDHLAISRKGARGLMQIMPQNFKTLDIQDPFDPHQNIMGGARYFRSLLDRYQGKLSLTLAAYNAGPNAVDRYRRIPPYAETQDYVEKVLRFYEQYKNNTRL